MKIIDLSGAYGMLLNAVASGGVGALWSMARSRGVVGELAITAIEILTHPYANVTVLEAITLAYDKHSNESSYD